MREIKFRAWDKFTKKMWQWEDHNAFSTSKGSIKDWFTDHDLIPLQYTGIKDVEGVEIYEGDIVAYWYENNSELETYAIIREDDCCNMFAADVVDREIDPNDGLFLTNLIDHCEVIGNIYQNPEMAK